MRPLNVRCRRGHLRAGNTKLSKHGKKLCRPCKLIASKRASDKMLYSNNRELAIQRDGEKCVDCGVTRTEHKEVHGRDITVNHIDNKGCSKPVEEKNNELGNLETLCLPCHASKDNRAKKLTDIQVINIRHCKGSIREKELAEIYGVSFQYIGQLWNNKWRRNLLVEVSDGK